MCGKKLGKKNDQDRLVKKKFNFFNIGLERHFAIPFVWRIQDFFIFRSLYFWKMDKLSFWTSYLQYVKAIVQDYF